MRKALVSLGAMALLASLVVGQPLGAGASGSLAAGATAPGAVAAGGFNSQTLVFELSLFLPQEALGKAFGATLGGPGRGRQGMAADGGGGPSAMGSGPNGGAFGAGGAGGSPGAQPGGAGAPQPQASRLVRDPKLYLSRDQVDRLLPILAALRDNPMPSPSKARKIESDIDTILTKAQKSEYADWLKAMEKFREGFRQRLAASRGGNGGNLPGGQAPIPGEAASGGASPGGSAGLGDAAPGRPGGNGAATAPGRGMSTLERRQRLLDSFIAALGEYRRGL